MREITIVLLTCLFVIGVTGAMHKCPYELCPMKGELFFSGCDPTCVEDSDCYALDKIHWDHPSLTYDECEDFLFSNL